MFNIIQVTRDWLDEDFEQGECSQLIDEQEFSLNFPELVKKMREFDQVVNGCPHEWLSASDNDWRRGGVVEETTLHLTDKDDRLRRYWRKVIRMSGLSLPHGF